MTQYYNVYCNIQMNGMTILESYKPFMFLLMFFIFPFTDIWNIRSTAIKLDYERD